MLIRTVDALRRAAGADIGERALWLSIRPAYAALLAGLIDAELYKTFYNTLARRLFATRGVDGAIEFMAMDVEPVAQRIEAVQRVAFGAQHHRHQQQQRRGQQQGRADHIPGQEQGAFS